MSPAVTIVVPCYNEARRLRADAFRAFATSHSCVRFLFVNDGSTDDTPLVLGELVAGAPERFDRIDLPRNGGKAVAVRAGMLHAFAAGGQYAGYWDADLATPLREILRFMQVLAAHPERDICTGARVRLLGRTIVRRASRHYMGRVFATAASAALRLPIYDTQCGAKLFRVTPEMQALFAAPFLTSWCFDVEVIARLAHERQKSGGPGPSEVIYELPLEEWRDVEGSKVGAADFLKAMVEIAQIRRRYLR